jgi:hypothetical protein
VLDPLNGDVIAIPMRTAARGRRSAFLAPAASALAALLSVCAPPVAAQDSRAEELARKQAEKAERLKPYVPSAAERIIVNLQRKFLELPGGFYPYLDSVYSGGGFALGGGYRWLYGDHSMWDVKGLYSVKSYKLVEVATLSPGHAGGRLKLGASGGWRDATQVNYYGLGMDSSPDDRTNFRFQQAYAGGIAELRPLRFIVIGGGLAYEDFTTLEGEGSTPSIEEVYTEDTAPGLGASPAFVHSEATAAIDWRTSPGYSRAGGFYGLTFHDYADPDDTYSFSRLDAEIVQHVPILRETWVISLRGRVQTTLDDEDLVPYFLLPSLGSGSTLRAYQSWRFRDRHSLLLSAEWRWIPNRLGMDMAIFYDASKVTSRREDLSFDGLASNWGIGVRFHSPLRRDAISASATPSSRPRPRRPRADTSPSSSRSTTCWAIPRSGFDSNSERSALHASGGFASLATESVADERPQQVPSFLEMAGAGCRSGLSPGRGARHRAARGRGRNAVPHLQGAAGAARGALVRGEPRRAAATSVRFARFREHRPALHRPRLFLTSRSSRLAPRKAPSLGRVSSRHS